MGNRAIITTGEREMGLYLHWNGGRDSVEAFLEYCAMRGFRGLPDDYGWARLSQVVSNFMGAEGLSVGLLPYTNDLEMDPGDNGIYIVRGWSIVERLMTAYDDKWNPSGMRAVEDDEEQMAYELDEMLRAIDLAQPAEQQLGDVLGGERVKIADLMPGDEVYRRKSLYKGFELGVVGESAKTADGKWKAPRLEDGTLVKPYRAFAGDRASEDRLIEHWKNSCVRVKTHL